MKPFGRWLFPVGALIIWLGLLFVSEAGAAVTLDSSLSVIEIYTDNLFFTERNREDEFGTFVSPGLRLAYRSRDVDLRGTYRGIAQFFVNNTDANTYAQNANFDIALPSLAKRFKGLRVRLFESFFAAPQLRAFSFYGEPGREITELQRMVTRGTRGGRIRGGGALGPILSNQGIFTRRNDSLQNLAGVGLTYPWTPRVSPTFTYSNRLTFFSSDEFRDSVSHFIRPGLRYQWSPRTVLRTTYRVNVTDFKATNNQPAESFVSHSARIGARHRFSQTLEFSGNVGASITEARTNFNFNTRIIKLFSLGSATLRLNQRVGPGGGLAAVATLNQSATGTFATSFGRRLTGLLLLGFARNTSLSTDDIDTLTYQAATGVQVLLLSWLSGSVAYSYVNQESNGIVGEGGKRNNVSFGLTAIAPTRRIVD